MKLINKETSPPARGRKEEDMHVVDKALIKAGNTLKAKAELAAASAKGKLSEKKSGIDQIVIMLIIIAVGAALLGIVYAVTKGVIKNTWEPSFNSTMKGWFDESSQQPAPGK